MDEAGVTDKVSLLLGGKIIAFDTPPTCQKKVIKFPSIEEIFKQKVVKWEQ